MQLIADEVITAFGRTAARTGRATKKPADKAVTARMQSVACKTDAMVRVSANTIIPSPPLIVSEAEVATLLSARDAGLSTAPASRNIGDFC